MKRTLSVFALLCRSTLLQLLGVCLAVCGAQALAFSFVIRLNEAAPGLETALKTGRTALLWGLGFVLVTALLYRTGWHGASHMEYTLQRLSVSERWVAVQQAIHGSLCYFVYWACQLLTVAALALWYRTHYYPGPEGSQLLMLAAYRSPLVHGLLPLANTTRWAANAALMLCLGTQAAAFAHKRRHGRIGTVHLVPAAMTLLVFCRLPDSPAADVLIVIFALLLAVVPLARLSEAEQEEAAHETT